MFDHHRKSPWFAEKYDPAPEFVNLRMRVRKEGWRGRVDAFLSDLESGTFDPDLREPEAEPSSPVKEKANGDAATDGNAAAEEDNKPSGEDDMQFNDVDDEAGDHDTSRADINGKSSTDRKRVDRGEEVSVPTEGNQVMIRTIPPDIGRVKLEEVSNFRLYSVLYLNHVYRTSQKFRALSILHLVILCKSVTTTVQAGSNSEKMLT